MHEQDYTFAEERIGSDKRIGAAERDIVALGIAAAAIIMFVGTGSAVLPQTMHSLFGNGSAPNVLLVNALLLNIALIIFGWRRYRQLLEEIEERRRAEEKARILAETDALTGCLNRRSIAREIGRMLDHGASSGEVVVVMMIDLDNFKQVNDFHGHSVGDAILIESARRIRQALPRRSVLARHGGDEFACAFTYASDRRLAIDTVASAIVESASKPVMVGGTQVSISTSVGISQSDESVFATNAAIDSHTLMNMADIAMYQAKRLGKNGHAWFEAPMEDELRFRREIEDGIREGIARGEFVPYYEQQIDLQSGELTGFEMLARWNSPKMGIVGPDIFIPIAEEIGAIAEISECVIAQALQDASGWDPKLTLAVNISPLQLRDPWFAQKILKMLLEANFPPERFEIEITESCLHENMTFVRTLVTSLKNQGIRVSLDDFGTGYSSLGQLRTLPFDRLKIDRTFICGLGDDQDAEAIVKAMALLGKGLGLPVTAEGIETDDVLSKLKEYENLKGQGYLYGKPAPAADVEKDLAARGLLALAPAPGARLVTSGEPEDVATEAPAPNTDQRLAGNG